MVNETQNRGNGNREDIRRVVRHHLGGGLAQEFLKPGNSFDDALARTVIRDEGQLYSITTLYQWMESFNDRGLFSTRKKALIHLLIGFNAVNGFNRSLAAMVGTGIYLPEGAGIKLSKDERKALTELQKARKGIKDEGEESEE